MTEETEIERWEDEGGSAIVATTRREQRQYENGPQGDQYAVDGREVTR